ncbi:MAG: tetratricopeptide repeat protein [Elusimicrobiaceae bacterium]|nr:tetratricopeptide repeat protein [Elusimicrobiaceae bacterium]
MSKHWVKEELKKNYLAGKTDRFLHWLRHNRELAAGLGGAAIVAILFTAYLNNRAQEKREFAWEELFKAEQTAYRAPEQGIKMLDEVGKTFPGTPAADYAALDKGDVLFKTGNYDEAVKSFKAAEAVGNPKTAPFAVNGQAVSLAAQKKYDEAIAAAQRLVATYPDSYLIPQAHLFTAQMQELSGKKEAARKTYEKLTTHFTDTAWAAKAKSRLGALSGMAQTAAASIPPQNNNQ